MNEWTNQSISQSINQWISQSDNELISQIHQSTNRDYKKRVGFAGDPVFGFVGCPLLTLLCKLNVSTHASIQPRLDPSMHSSLPIFTCLLPSIHLSKLAVIHPPTHPSICSPLNITRITQTCRLPAAFEADFHAMCSCDSHIIIYYYVTRSDKMVTKYSFGHSKLLITTESAVIKEL